MAAANTTSMSGLYANNTKWLAPNPPWDQVLDLVGGEANTNAPEAKKAVLNLAARSPTVIAFVLAEDPDLILTMCWFWHDSRPARMSSWET